MSEGERACWADGPGGGGRTRAALREARRRQARERLGLAARVAACLVFLLLGWAVGRWSGAPRAAAVSLFLVAYAAGGFDSALRVLRDLRRGELNIDLLMVAAALGAAAVGSWAEGAILLFLFSLSNALEQFILGRTRLAIETLMDLSPERALVRRDGGEASVPVEDLRAGDLLIVHPGERIAADGAIEAGRTAVDQAAVTGESMPVDREPGDPVFAGTLNQGGAIEVRVARPSADSTLSRIIRLVEDAQGQKAESEQFTAWFGRRYTVGVLVGTAAVFLVPVLALGEPPGRAFYRAMTAMVVASPCAVVISIPSAILSAIAGAARGGVLFKGGTYLERAAGLRAIAFDKTGTLTVGRPRLVDLVAAEGVEPDEVLRLAAAAEALSEHPLARAVIEAAAGRGLDPPPASDLQALVGRGLEARVEGRAVRVGKPALFDDIGGVPAGLADAAARLAAAGRTTVFVGDDARVLGVLAIADTLRPGAVEAIAELRALGVAHLVMLTGDNPVVARAIAEGLGLAFRAELLPQDKLRAIEDLRRDFGAVAMVGDGINDAPSLAAATLGISIGAGGTDVALETADVVLMAGDLRDLPYAIGLSRQAGRVIRQNLVFAFGVMAVLLLITLAGRLPLPLAVFGHEGSTVLVILNGLRLLAYPRPAGS